MTLTVACIALILQRDSSHEVRKWTVVSYRKSQTFARFASTLASAGPDDQRGRCDQKVSLLMTAFRSAMAESERFRCNFDGV